MAVFYYYVLFMSALLTLGQCGCRKADWSKSFDTEGVSRCDGRTELVNGFYRSGDAKNDPLFLLEAAECCNAPYPWSRSKTQIVYANWWAILDSPNRWAYCPPGFFLKGLYRSSNKPGILPNIEEGRCLKPADHPYHHGHCYDQDITACFDKAGVCKCNPGYFVSGLFRGGCDQLHCLEKLRCCKMVDKPETMDDIFKVKTRIMDTTQVDIALVAAALGYGWCSGCRALFTGEDFKRSGDTWVADKSARCSGYMNQQRLSMAYGDWSFDIKDIKYGKPVIQELKPEIIDYATMTNDHSTPTTQTLKRSTTFVRSVTHTTTSAWKDSTELGSVFTFSPPEIFGDADFSTSYKFSYEKSTSITDSKGKQQTNTFEAESTKTLAPHTAAKWNLILSKTRSTVSYTATIIVKFSTELRGFLRWGGGAGSIGTNYHYQHTGSGKRPTFNYRFGNAKIPFYTALKRESDTNSYPWLWNDAKNADPSLKYFINDLSNENRYVFQLTGKFEDVVGKHADIKWEEPKKISGRKRSKENEENEVKNLKHVAQASPDDPPAPNPDPPVVEIYLNSSLPYSPTRSPLGH